MPEAGPVARAAHSQAMLVALCSLLLASSVCVWLFAFFPLMGNDYKFWVPLIYEGRMAWGSFGAVSYDFSPLRCLGLPSFSSPNSLLFSIFHWLSLLGSDLLALVAGIAFIFFFAFFGALKLFRSFGLSDRAALLMAFGWCLQGWACARMIAGHLPFIQLLLLPWLLHVTIAGRARLLSLAAAAFWFSHMLYSGAFYSFIIAAAGIAICLAVLRLPFAASLARFDGVLVLRNAAAIALMTSAMSAPKVLGVMNFLALFPREARLVQVSFWKSMLYAAANLTLPVPIRYGGLVGWGFGSWESYQFLYPGLFFVLLLLTFQRKLRARLQIGLTLLGLLALSATLTSGLAAPLFAALPVLESLHVNPRWNGLILLPALLLACVVIVESAFLERGRDRAAFWVLMALFVLAPLQFLDRVDMRIGYLYHDGIRETQKRVDMCYEPIFGYGLEGFPGNPRRIDWLSAELRDPRCLLARHDCRPGSEFEHDEDRHRLERFELVDDDAPVAMLRLPALAFYLLGFVSALWCLVVLFRDALRSSNHPMSPRSAPG